MRVILPDGAYSEQEGKQLPPGRDEFASAADRQFLFNLITIVLIVPALICLTIDLLISGSFTWSLLVLGSLAAVWVVFVSPLLLRKRVFPLWIVFDMLAIAGLLALIETFSPAEGW